MRAPGARNGSAASDGQQPDQLIAVPAPAVDAPARQAPVGPVDLLASADRPARGGRRARLVRRSLAAADLTGLSLAFFVASLLHSGGGAGNQLAFEGEYALFLATLPAWLLVAKLHGLYDRDEERADRPTTDDMVAVFHLVTVGTWLLLAVSLVTGLAHPEPIKLVVFWLLAICVMPICRALARELCRRSAAFVQNAVIVGAGDVGQLVARKLIRHSEYGINVVGFVDRLPRARRDDLPERLAILGPPEQLPEIIERFAVERVVISFSIDPPAETLRLVRSLMRLNVQVDLVPRLFDVVGPRVAIHTIENLPLVGLPPARFPGSSRVLKRTLDVAGASLGLVLTSPLFAYIAWRIKRESPGPVLFRQARVGCEMRQFTALKFRTMKVGTDTAAHRAYIRRTMSRSTALAASGMYKLDREDSVTATGRWLRKTSLDELPQLINVLKGEMSLVGPRPCIPYEIEHFKPYQLERFDVPQGLTGLWQVTARANATFGEALDMDVAYARGWSFGLDLRLLLRTPFQLLRQWNATT